ncbi:transmembrane protein 70 homolog, mitochondrial-like isoform X1 [Varroa jacobsoni]|uniref:transmembrane protein 70 homolog, mitochondrial-like isoform X1 n=2 Tax=Varroa jacobsoni TaxID=62625 RepID=UPI000BF4B1D1|nr:transmembrane protein 70 homolog, mitochondrial-like isoform X1 [Varroa jacobsoni]
MLCYLVRNSRRYCLNKNVATTMVRLDSATTNSRPGKPKLHSFNDLRPVYTGSLNTQVKSVKAFSLTSSVIALALQPLMFEKLVLNQPVLTGVFLGTGCLGFILGTPLLLHYVTKRYVIELRFSAQSRIFEADTYSLLLRRQTLRFTAADVNVPSVPGPITSIVALGKPLLIDFNLFTDADAYEHLLGYDKPLNLQFNEIKSNSS